MSRIGRQSPTLAVVLPYSSTHGKEAVDIYATTGRTAQPWQEEQINNILATNEDGLFTHLNYGLAVPRRNGKNEVIVMRELWGLEHGQRMCHTAHRTTTSTSAFQRLYRLLISAGYVEHSRKLKDRPEKCFFTLKQYGLESIELNEGGSIFFRTRTTSGGLGEGFDLLVIDEAQEYTDKQQSALAYTVSDSRNPQTIFTGTPPTATSAGTVFTKMREEAVTGRSSETGWAEWSVEEQPEDPMDPELWYMTNPSLGTILTERNVRAEMRGDVLDFCIQRLGLWLRYEQKSAISAAEWEECKGQIPELEAGRYWGVKFGKDGKNVSLALAARTRDGKIFVEAISCAPIRAGNHWLFDYFRNPGTAAVVVDGQSGQLNLANEMKDKGLTRPKLPSVGELVSASALFEQSLFGGGLVHTGQKSLADVVSHCERRPIGSNGGFGYRSLDATLDISIMEAVVLAHWAAKTDKGKDKKQNISY